MTRQIYDLVIIGAGPAGYVAAIRGAQLGMNVALIEKRKNPGGTCLNIGCIPSKALLESSELFYQVKNHLKDHGIVAGHLELDLKRMMERKEKIVEQLTGGVALLLKHNRVTMHNGMGKLIGPSEVEITAEKGKKTVLTTRYTLLATGSEPVRLPFLPYDGTTIVSSTEVLSFQHSPKKLIVIGAGYVGLELGSVWSRLGSEVIVIELMPQILPGMDADVAKYMTMCLRRQGMSFYLSTKMKKYSKEKDQVRIIAEDSESKSLEFSADKVLVAVGRAPFYQDIGVEELGIALDDKTGFIRVDDKYQTSVNGVYAIGDIAGGPMLAHKAHEEGISCVENLVGISGKVNYNTIPKVMYTSPEVASVGKTEEQAAADEIEYKIGTFNYRANGRALTMGRQEGFVKIIAEKKSDTVIGVHIVGPFASELVSEAVTIMEFGGSAEDIARTMHAHPTLSEAVKEAALSVDNRPIHSLPSSGKAYF